MKFNIQEATFQELHASERCARCRRDVPPGDFAVLLEHSDFDFICIPCAIQIVFEAMNDCPVEAMYQALHRAALACDGLADEHVNALRQLSRLVFGKGFPDEP